MTDLRFLSGLGEKIRELRLERGMSQNELAIECDFDKASMSRIESGKTNITILNLRKISVALSIDIFEFFRA